MMIFFLGRWSLLDFSVVVGDLSRHSLFDRVLRYRDELTATKTSPYLEPVQGSSRQLWWAHAKQQNTIPLALTSFKRLWRNLAAGSFGGCMRNCKPLKHFLLLLASFFPHILLALQLSSLVCFFLLRLAPSYCLQMDKKQHPCCW